MGGGLMVQAEGGGGGGVKIKLASSPVLSWSPRTHHVPHKAHLCVHADRGNGTCYPGQSFIYRIRTSHCRLPQACLDLSDEIGSHWRQYHCS